MSGAEQLRGEKPARGGEWLQGVQSGAQQDHTVQQAWDYDIMTCIMTCVMTCFMKCIDMCYGKGMCFSGFRTRVLILRQCWNE